MQICIQNTSPELILQDLSPERLFMKRSQGVYSEKKTLFHRGPKRFVLAR